ncbi:MAG: DUF362 domain-containing protein [Gammaproteobacteria bacterium]|nr:DUF362 domain-containing protein [Gammaproteobacteria bacterium]
MQNTTRFLLTDREAGVGADDVPRLFRLRQRFPRPVEPDVPGAVRREIAPFLSRLSPGQRIAISGSSRGITDQLPVLRECAAALRDAGAEPFVVPGMGSHGGATAEGQIAVLAEAGISEDTVGCPIHSSMEVVQVGTTATGFPVCQDRLAYDADGVLVFCRVKPHTGFTGRVESGLCKMMVIGLGKQAGASRIHQQALRHGMERLVLDAARIIVEAERPHLVGGIAVVENAYKETAVVSGVALDDYNALVDSEAMLLRESYELLPRLPFDDLDALIVDEIGKNVSGSGMDSNVTGKKPGMERPRIGCIYVRGLTEVTHGNAIGIGYADLMPRQLLEQIDLNKTYMNAFTAKHMGVGKIPVCVENELQAMQIMLNYRQDTDPASLRLAWIRNTLKLDEMWASQALLAEANANADLEILSDPVPARFDETFKLVEPEGVVPAA